MDFYFPKDIFRFSALEEITAVFFSKVFILFFIEGNQKKGGDMNDRF